MKITKIAVRKLFGVFDHDIPLNDEGITIVIGENGLGKTVILEATSAFFSENYLFFRDLDFKQFIFHFEGEEYWEVTKTQSTEKLTIYVHRGFTGKNLKIKQEKIADIDLEGGKSPDGRRRMEMLRYQQQMLYLDAARHGIVESKLLDERRIRDWAIASAAFDDDAYFKAHFAHSKEAKPVWLTAAAKKISIKLIETQRIITAKERGGEAYVNRVTKSAKELAETIAEIDKTSSQTATELGRVNTNSMAHHVQRKSLAWRSHPSSSPE